MMHLSDTVLVQVITTAGTIITVVITGLQNRKTTRDKADETHNRLDLMTRLEERGQPDDRPTRKPPRMP